MRLCAAASGEATAERSPRAPRTRSRPRFLAAALHGVPGVEARARCSIQPRPVSSGEAADALRLHCYVVVPGAAIDSVVLAIAEAEGRVRVLQRRVGCNLDGRRAAHIEPQIAVAAVGEAIGAVPLLGVQPNPIGVTTSQLC